MPVMTKKKLMKVLIEPICNDFDNQEFQFDLLKNYLYQL